MWRIKPNVCTDACVCVRNKQSSPSFINSKRKHSTVEPLKEWRKTFETYAKQNNISPTDWYQLSTTSLDEKTQQLVSQHFGGYLNRALSVLFPEIEWKAWKFQHYRVPQNFWKEQSNQRKFFDDLGHQLGIKNLDDWYEALSKKGIIKDGSGLLAQNKNSQVTALMAAYPEHNWIPWKFSKVLPGYWNDVTNKKSFFDDLGKKLGVEKLDDWYLKLSKKEIEKHGGCGLLDKHNNSPIAALMAAYPEHDWVVYKFAELPKGYWKNMDNQKKFFDDLGKQLGVEKLDDWYSKLNSYVVKKNGGNSLLRKYQKSPTAALMATYPEHHWISWKFGAAPKFMWNSKENVKQALQELSEKLSIQTLDDWYRVDREQLKFFGASGILRNKGLYHVLKEQYPHHPWNLNRFKQNTKKTQRWLALTLKKLFPNEEILEDYVHPEAVFPTSKRPIQLDIYIPSKSLAFEYQGQQHYQDIGIFSHTASYQVRDEEKRAVCAANNIKLIEVPYWWNRTQESLQEIMQKSGLTEK